MPRNKVTEVFKYEELSDSAKQKAREWYLGMDGGLDYEWWDSVYDDFVEVCKILGVELADDPVRLMGGGVRYKPRIAFSGFGSQGDGASFEGCFRGKLDMVEKIKEYAPLDEDLHNIAACLYVDFVEPYNATCRVDISTTGRYSHSHTMRFEFNDFENSEGEWEQMEDRGRETVVENNLRWLADWLYTRLEKDYDWLTSDEVVAENIIANGYEFDENGSPE
jgi:hypothetical protein